MRVAALLWVADHRAKLQHREGATVLTDAQRPVEHRAVARKTHSDRDGSQQRRKEDQEKACHDSSEDILRTPPQPGIRTAAQRNEGKSPDVARPRAYALDLEEPGNHDDLDAKLPASMHDAQEDAVRGSGEPDEDRLDTLLLNDTFQVPARAEHLGVTLVAEHRIEIEKAHRDQTQSGTVDEAPGGEPAHLTCPHDEHASTSVATYPTAKIDRVQRRPIRGQGRDEERPRRHQYARRAVAAGQGEGQCHDERGDGAPGDHVAQLLSQPPGRTMDVLTPQHQQKEGQRRTESELDLGTQQLDRDRHGEQEDHGIEDERD